MGYEKESEKLTLNILYFQEDKNNIQVKKKVFLFSVFLTVQTKDKICLAKCLNSFLEYPWFIFICLFTGNDPANEDHPNSLRLILRG